MKIALGTVQFGMSYGIANLQGKVSFNETEAILDHAAVNGINMLDTAIAYGDSEERLGKIGIPDWSVVSKLPAVPDDCSDISQWVEDSVKGSLHRLKIKRLYGLLLHRPLQLLEHNGDRLYNSLQKLINDGIVQKIGVSIYDPIELDEIFKRYRFDIVQAPFNILDRRLINTGWLSRLAEKGTELHVRSIFLQGLLLMMPDERPQKFDRWASLWTEWQRWLEQTGMTPLQICLRYALSIQEINKVIVGVDSLKQLKEIFHAIDGPVPQLLNKLNTNDQDLINPSRWGDLI